MVKAKHSKSKPNKQKKPSKQTHIRKHGKGDISEVRDQLDALGLKIIEVTSDGNCFFRALADQLEGSEEEHEKYRSMVVQYIEKQREMFEPFIEDEVPFEEYCKSMKEDGTWAGHMELQAASLVTHTNICIHKNKSPRWYLQNFDNHKARMIHLSYHDGEHYNSVRLKEDSCTGPARPIMIKVDSDLAAPSRHTKVDSTKSKCGSSKNSVLAESIKLVMAGSQCVDRNKVEQVLQQVGGDVDVAIAFLLAEQDTEEFFLENDKEACRSNTSYGKENGHCKHGRKDINEHPSTSESSCKGERSRDNKKLHDDEKKIPRNKVCPCGSKKKYKACCGSVSGKSSTQLAIDQTVDLVKNRKVERKQSKKGKSGNAAKSDGETPDVGALCI